MFMATFRCDLIEYRVKYKICVYGSFFQWFGKKAVETFGPVFLGYHDTIKNTKFSILFIEYNIFAHLAKVERRLQMQVLQPKISARIKYSKTSPICSIFDSDYVTIIPNYRLNNNLPCGDNHQPVTSSLKGAWSVALSSQHNVTDTPQQSVN